MSGALPHGTVTFLFSDIEASTELLRELGDVPFAAVRADHRRLLREAFSEHGGHEMDTAGDGFFVAFETAGSAVAAALAAQRAVGSFEWPAGARMRVRIGLHTAEPHVAADGYVGVGVHRASRICDTASGGQIILSNATAGIVEDASLPGVAIVDLGEHELKGLPHPQRLFQLVAPGLGLGPGALRRPDGRAAEPTTGTFVFADITDWRCVIRALGDESSAALAREYHAVAAAAAAAERGTVVEAAADHVLMLFGGAAGALRAASEVRARLADFVWPPECTVNMTITIHTGRWSGDLRRIDAPTAMLRLMQLAGSAEPGQTLVSQTTAALTEGDASAPSLRSLGERQLPGVEEPQRIYEVAVPD